MLELLFQDVWWGVEPVFEQFLAQLLVKAVAAQLNELKEAYKWQTPIIILMFQKMYYIKLVLTIDKSYLKSANNLAIKSYFLINP